MAHVDLERWKIAQKHEQENWDVTFKKKLIKGINLKDYSYFLSFLRSYITLSGKALDIGSGAFSICEETELEGLAIDPLMKFYSTKFNIVKNVMHLQGVGEKLPIKSNSIDIVFVLDCIDHTQNIDKIFDETRRVLKPGGHLLVSVNCFGRLIKAYRKIIEQIQASDEKHPYSFHYKDVENLLRKHGFKIIARKNELVPVIRRINWNPSKFIQSLVVLFEWKNGTLSHFGFIAKKSDIKDSVELTQKKILSS